MEIWDGELKDITNLVSSNYLQINSCGFQNTSPGYCVTRKHGRKDYHILLLSTGNCEVMHNNKMHTLSPGNLVLYSPDEGQKYIFTTKSVSLWCHFTGTATKEILNSYKLTSGVYNLNPNKAILESYSDMIQEFNRADKKLLANASLLKLLYYIFDATQNDEQNNKENIILPILTYINTNYNKKITLDKLSIISGYSKSRLSHVFSEIMGTTPIQYQNDMRLKISCEMLLSTKYNIKEIAVSCGFSDPLYYSKIFKKKYGVSPKEYRANYKNIL